MLFNSFDFILFFTVVTPLYFILPHRWRWLHLLLSSCLFYMAFIPAYIFILLALIVVDYVAGLCIERAAGPRRKLFLIISIVSNLGMLAFFKYYNFFVANVDGFINLIGVHTTPLPMMQVILPIGLSFHTFQAMSYTIEVYRGKQSAEKHFGIYALYVMFYPQLAAGPIERPQNMIHQFRERHFFDPMKLSDGLKLMLWGLFMKVVIADRLGIYINAIYNNAGEHNGNTLLLATFFFSFQLYCDFAGYSLIAIGSARTMGFELMTNFRRPYFSTSVAEFWSRWHISLSTWFRDYVYIPLGGNRVPLPRYFFNIMVVALLSGLWHGASWTYVIWGGLNGVYLIGGLMFDRIFPALATMPAGLKRWIKNFIQLGILFFIFMIARIFFRATSVDEAMLIIRKIFTDRQGDVFVPHGRAELVYCWLAFTILFAVEAEQEFFPGRLGWMHNSRVEIRFASILLLIVGILLLGVFDSGQFIYFQF